NPRRAGDGTTRKGSAQKIDRAKTRTHLAHHRRDQVKYRRVGFEGAELGYRHTSVAADAREVVAQQIDDHNVLGIILFTCQQLSGKALILLGRAPSWPRALDGARLDPAIAQGQESLRRGRC